MTEIEIQDDLKALRYLFQVNEGAAFQFLVLPFTIAELASKKELQELGKHTTLCLRAI